MRYYSIKSILKKSLIITAFAMLVLTDTVFAGSHAFKYTPTDTENTTSFANVGSANDTNGVSYWSRTAGTSFIQTPVTWTTLNYLYIFIEGNGNYLYNQFYVNGGTGHANLSFFSSFGHDPDKVATFTVDGKNVSMYRLYTEAGISPNNGLNILTQSNGSNPYRIYGVYPSNGTPAVTNQATMYAFLNSFTDTSTHIIDFTPAEGSLYSATSSVPFSLSYYLNPADVGTIASVRVTFHNIDQNTLLSSLSNDDIVFINEVATTSGIFSFSSSTMLTKGNYRIEASLDRSLAWGYLRNPFSSINTTQSHQFIVGSSTFIGNISQNTFSQVQSIYNSYNATSSAVMAQSCNLLSNFDTLTCIGFLFIPSSDQLNSSLTSLRDNVLVKAPWGYFNRMYNIFQTSATGTLAVATVHIYTGGGSYQTVSVDMGDMIIGAGANLNSISSPINHKSIRDVLEPMVKLLIALAVVFTIFADVTGSHRHETAKKHST